MTAPPSSLAAADAVAVLAGALVGGPLPLAVRCWDGSSSPGPPGAPTLVVRTPRALRRLLWAPSELGLARAYVSGDLDIEGDLEAALRLPDALPERPDLRLHTDDVLGVLGIAGALARLRVLGPPPRLPAEEARLGGRLHSRRRDAAAITHHYDVGNDFYRLLLGPSMVYSCAVWPGPFSTLEEAQAAKLDRICAKLDLRPGERLLDVGCGWGSLLLHAATQYGVRGVGVTLSASQADLARERVADAGLADRLEVRLQDYREVADGPYDAVTSVGMAEHVGREQLGTYARQLHRLLRPGGRLLNHVIAVGPQGSTATADDSSFVTRYVFPDGDLQTLGTHVSVLEEAGFEVRDVEALREHYARTCRAWVSNLEASWDEAVRLTSPGRARVWRLYLAGSAIAFDDRRVGVDQVVAVVPGGTPPPRVPGQRASG